MQDAHNSLLEHDKEEIAFINEAEADITVCINDSPINEVEINNINDSTEKYHKSIIEGGQEQDDVKGYKDIEVKLMHEHNMCQKWSNEEPPPEPPPIDYIIRKKLSIPK